MWSNILGYNSTILFTFNLAFSFLSSVLDFEQDKQPIGTSVTLDYGTFNGFSNESTGIIYFRGVRYADAPIGDLRWRAPVSPPTEPLGTVNATEFADACIAVMQIPGIVPPSMSEDCLFGNVYIPINTSVGDTLPVLVWFYGGGYEMGSTHNAPPELIMNSSVYPLIFVSFEYRLGQFGFLGGTEIASNGSLNAGLLDQRAALRWVQRYIHLFGGDKSNVTIWGESSGAGSAMLHLIANGGDNENLFRAAIGDSPTLSFLPLFNESYVQHIFYQFVDFAGFMDNTDPLSCLRSANTSTLTDAGFQLISAHPATLFVFSPIVDGSLIQQRPVEAFNSGNFVQVPVLFGSNTNEGANMSAHLPDPNANTSMPNATETTVFNFLQGQYASMTQASFQEAVDLYYPLADYNNSYDLQGQQMFGEAMMICTASLISGSVYQFQEAYAYHYDNPHLGSYHMADLAAFFSPPPYANTADLALFEAMREYWTSFVTTGVPGAKNSSEWKPVTGGNGSPRLLLQPNNISIELVGDELTHRCGFWHGLSSEIQT